MPAADRDRPRLCRVAGRDAWHIYHARRRVSTGCKDRASAELVLSRYLGELSRPQLAVVSIASILERYLADRVERAIPGAERLRWAHKPLARILGTKPPEAIGEAECRAYAARRAREQISPATVRTELQALRAALNWAARGDVIAKAPTVALPPRPPPRSRWLTRDEAERLVAACKSHHVRLFTQLALHTAARAGAILALTWDRVDLVGRRINFAEPGRAVTRKGRSLVPINDTLLAALEEAQQLAVTEWVVEYGGGQVGSVKHAFHRAADAAGLKDVTPHTLRHTAATWMAQKGVSLWDIAGFLGHSSLAMIEQTYGHHSPDYLAEAARALG